MIIDIVAGTWRFLPWNLMHINVESAHRVRQSTTGYYAWWVFSVSYAILLFNLLPIFPLDGGQMVQSLLWVKIGYYRATLFACVTGMIGAGIVAVQVFTLFEDPDYCGAGVPQCLASFTSDQKRALDWIYRRRDQLKIAAINMSLGSGFHEEACDGISALTPVIEQLRARNIPTVIAAGNERFFDALAEPACISFAVSVSALDKNKELDVSYSNVSKRVTLAAPGSNIVSAVYDGKLGKKSGTSMAAPHVAAAFALLREQNPQQSIKMMLDQMLASGSRATDRRTDTTVARLDLSGAATVAVSEGSGTLSKPAEVPWGALPLADSNAGTTRGIAPPREAAPPLSSGATKVSEQKPVEPPSHSYIIKTTKPPAEVKAALENCAGGITCDVRQIGTDAYKVDVKPLPAAPPAPDRAAIEKMIGGDAKVYDNRLSKPLQ